MTKGGRTHAPKALGANEVDLPRPELGDELRRALAECERLRRENARLRALLEGREAGDALPLCSEPVPATRDSAQCQAGIHSHSPSEAKIALFRRLFRGREDVYARRWEGKTGKSGYSPACAQEWKPGLCRKPAGKCADCPNREYLPLTDAVVAEHLKGEKTLGVYPLLPDETCWFLAADFDKAAWREDVAAFLWVCREWGVPASLERSRSGNGAHVWIFFEEPVPARLARQFGSALLTRAMESRYQIGLDSYDRFFPNQDTLPKGGLGNLIALPLQWAARQQGNTVFLDESFASYPDPWAYLSSVSRLAASEVSRIVSDASAGGDVLGVRAVEDDEERAAPWRLPPSGAAREKPIQGPLPEKMSLVLGNFVYVEKTGLPPGLLNRLIRLAAFQNPEFYRAQAMRLSTFGKPRVIRCAEEFRNHVGLPRGCLEEARALLEGLGIAVTVQDERVAGVPLDVSFQGELTERQATAAEALLAHDTGVLSAATAFGKTVVASWLIAARNVNTLVLVHRAQLLDQWRERLATFLGIPKKSIGQIGGAKAKRTGRLDVATFQSLIRKGEVKDLVAEYGHVAVDECHHVSAFAFEQVLRKVKARYVLGLTATPIRKDGHHPIITMQCGPIRYRVDAKADAALRPFEHVVLPRPTDFYAQPEILEAGIQSLYGVLARDEARNEVILQDLVAAIEAGRSPLLLTERVEHLEEFERRLREHPCQVVVFRGGIGKKQRRALAETLAGIPETERRVILATGRCIGEGFDDARLDTLFLALPISWRGTLQQYAGRLHRLHAGKKVVRIHDYVDAEVPVLARMYQRRLRGYRAMGYEVQQPR
jgi:superfamily II DNA or RNA helicase